MIEGKQSQLQKVKQILELGAWVTLYELARLVEASECGVSSRIRDLRKYKYGGYIIVKRKINPNTYQYRLVS
jgi:hypothetical protein